MREITLDRSELSFSLCLAVDNDENAYVVLRTERGKTARPSNYMIRDRDQLRGYGLPARIIVQEIEMGVWDV